MLEITITTFTYFIMQVAMFILLNFAISAIKSKCVPSNLSFVNFQKRPKRSIPYIIEIEADKCPGYTEFYYKWEIECGNEGVVQSSSTSSIFIDGYNYPSSKVFSNKYFITVHVSHLPDMSLKSTLKGAALFAADSMHLQIKGGSEKSHAADSDLLLDAKSLSKDISYPPHEDAFKEVIKRWFIEPKIPGVEDSETLFLHVPGKYLQAGQTYNFTLKAKRNQIPDYHETKYVSQLVKVLSKSSENINIECTRNCIYPHPKEVTILEVVINENTNINITNYNWSLSPSVDSNKVEFGNGFDKILIHPNAFKLGDGVTVTVKNNLSWSTYFLKYLDGIRKGTCYIQPKEGISGITKFKVNCLGFKSPRGIMMYMIYQKNGEDVMLNDDMTTEENEIYLSEGSPANVIVKVQDYSYIQDEIQLTVQVKPFSDGVASGSVLNTIQKLVLIDYPDSLLSFSREKNRNRVIQLVSFLLDALNKTETSESVKNDLHKHMAESIYAVEPVNFYSAIQTISILEKLDNFRVKTDVLTACLIGKAVINTVGVIHAIANHDNQVPIPTFYLNDFGNQVFKLSASILTKSDEIEKVLEKEVDIHDYESYDEFKSDKLIIRENLRELTQNIILTIEILGTSLLHLSLPEQKPIFIEEGDISFITQRVYPLTLLNKKITIENATETWVSLPKPLLKDLDKEYPYIDYQFAAFKSNPTWWHQNISNFKGDIIHFDLFLKCHKIKTLKHPLQLFIKVKEIPTALIKSSVNETEDNVKAHRIKIDADALLIVTFESSPQSFIVAASDCYCKPEDFSKGIEIKPSASEEDRTLTIRPLNGRNVVYICIMSLGATNLEYTGNISSALCVYWNLKTGKWQSDGCKIKQVNGSQIICECYHTSFFTGEILVPPNKINELQRISFKIILIRNWIMVLIIASVWIIWFILLIFAWIKDNNLMKSNIICKLDDNVPGDNHVYLMVIFTGVFLDAGTTADVAFQIIGANSVSRVHLIKCSSLKMLQRNSQDWFLVYTPFDLGEIKKIRIWHNCKGRKPHWYCKRIILQHLKTGQQWCFIVEKWFSLIWGKGKVYAELHPKRKNNLKSPKILFFVKLERGLKDKHLWLSVLTRDAQSNFNCKERVSCAFCALLLSMLASAMFYGVPKGGPSDSIDERSNYFVTYKEIAIFIESFLVTFPASFIVILIFRNSSPK